MARLPLDEVRRLVSYLRAHVADPDRLIEIEGELQGEEADVDVVESASGQAHVVTVFMGRGSANI